MNQTALVQPRRPEWFFFNESGVPISTFIPSVTGLVKTIGSKGEREEVRVKLCFKDGGSTEVTVPLSRLDYVKWFELDHRCLINSEYRRSKGYIADTIRAGVSKAPVEQRYSLDRTGIHHVDGTIVFAVGNRVITQSSAPEIDSVYELGQIPFHLDIDKNISPIEAIDGMMELISLSPEIGSVLVAHVISGFIGAAFKEAGIDPRTILFIVGKSGMLKSHYVPHLVQLYNRADGIGPATRFNSTERFIEETLYEYSECTVVIDDLHTAASMGIKRRNEKGFEEIIRRVSDDMGRGRMDGKALVQRHFQGNTVFIGEYSFGKASTIPRTLEVHLTKRPNGAILDKYQRSQPLLVSTCYKSEKHDGLIYYDCLCLRGKRLEQKLRDVKPSSHLDDCVSALLSQNALKLVESKNTVQINGTGGKRFYAIKLSKLR